MSEISRVALFGKLNNLCYQSIESSTVFCKMRGNPYVELVHWLHQILQLADSDLLRIIKEYELDPAILARDITAVLDQLPRGSTSVTDLSSQLEEAVERAWVYATLMFGESQVRSGHLMVGLLKTSGLRNAVLSVSKEFGKIRIQDLGARFNGFLNHSPEENMHAHDGFEAIHGNNEPGDESCTVGSAAMGRSDSLKRFTVDMTEQARSGTMDPIVGRDDEIRQVIDILMRRRQNNPILVGEAGVGKTAVAEGFAQRIVRGDVPPGLKDVQLLALDVGLLQAGASMKGEFEQRLRSVIDEVQASVKPIVLFIDETHTLVGAGGAAGTGDAANLLKPALARGSLRTLGATTFAEYKKHIEKDPALSRRFQTVQVDEPSELRALLMMRGVTAAMEQHHKVLILDSALEAAVRLSSRYIPARQLPDKAISLIDTACARVAVSLHATPAEVDDSQRRIEQLETELAIRARESAMGVDTKTRLSQVRDDLGVERSRLEGLEARWSFEQTLGAKILELRGKLHERAHTNINLTQATEREKWLVELCDLQAQLEAYQGEKPLVLLTVDEQAVASVVQDWTGIPVGRMVKNEIDNVLKLADRLSQRIIGQRHALEMITRRIQTSRAGLDNPEKPVGVFMLAGTSGVGKTETALALAEALYGGEQNIITINMSEYQEAHTVSTLKGAPPGYVGYGEGGVLTEAVRRKPYSVVLLDEVEKAHPDVYELFFQVFDKGWMEDGEGRVIDFKNTLILLTTNIGTEMISGLCSDRTALPDPDGIAQALRVPLLEIFPPALLGRLVVIPYYPLSDEILQEIIRLQLARIAVRVAEGHGIPFTYSDGVLKLIASRCTELESGGRMIDAILTNSVLPAISTEVLTRMLRAIPVQRVDISVQNGDFAYVFD
jgi:type VI secretion system protein VasG